MMKWKVMRNSRCNSIDHEDVRKSLEILDSVLAEFDDGAGDLWARLANDDDFQEKGIQPNGDANRSVLKGDNDSISSFTAVQNSLVESPTDGATSQAQTPNEEDKTFSPPPVPKRHPETRLSSRENLVSCTSMENIYSNDFEIRRNIFDNARNQVSPVNETVKTKLKKTTINTDEASSNSLSNQFASSKLISEKFSLRQNDFLLDDNDEVFVSQAKLTLSRSASAGMMTTSESLSKSPTVASRRALYEKSNNVIMENTKRPVIQSDSSDVTRPVRNSPFLRRKIDVINSPILHKRNFSDSSDLKSSGCQNVFPTNGNRFHPTTTPPSVFMPVMAKGSATAVSTQVPSKEERIALLNKKFAKVRHLLKTNQIRPLEYDPPQFVPAPPPTKIARKHSERTNDISPPKLNKAKSSSDIIKVQNSIVLATSSNADVLKCLSVPVVDAISNITCMLPTDTLNRPHLGLSYSMEDDLCPGVKEILTSTPKSDKSMIGLSTFSHSISSLGYSSGQSDLDLNLSSREENKMVPINSLKSQTLPIGMRLGPPFTYVTDIDYECDTRDPAAIAVDENVPIQYDDEKAHFRSFSAPPLKHLQRKNKFGMSRKEGKEKHKKEDNISLKSDLSMDDGILLRKITTLDGGTGQHDLSGRKQTSVCSEDKTKRRSVWKSILRRK